MFSLFQQTLLNESSQSDVPKRSSIPNRKDIKIRSVDSAKNEVPKNPKEQNKTQNTKRLEESAEKDTPKKLKLSNKKEVSKKLNDQSKNEYDKQKIKKVQKNMEEVTGEKTSKKSKESNEKQISKKLEEPTVKVHDELEKSSLQNEQNEDDKVLKNLKRKHMNDNIYDTVVDQYNQTIKDCFREEDTDSEEGVRKHETEEDKQENQIKLVNKTHIEENSKCHDEGTSILDGEGMCKEKSFLQNEQNEDDNVLKNLKRKHKNDNLYDTVVDHYNQTIKDCFREEDTDGEEGVSKDETEEDKQENQIKLVNKTHIEENSKCHDEGTSILDGEGMCKEKRVDNSVKIQEENVISLSNDSMDIEETNGKMKTGIQQKLIYQMKNKNDIRDSNDHSIENIIPTIQSDPVLQQSIPIGQNDHTDFSGQIFNINNENGIPQGINLQRGSPNVLDLRPINPYSEDAIAAARLMTDMAASKNFTNLPHSNMAETRVTSSGYGYCNPGNHGNFSPEYNRQNNPFQGNVHGQQNAPSSTWHPLRFGQPQDQYRNHYNQWEGSYQNDNNNNLINQGGPKTFQSHENSHFGNMGMPVRMSSTNTSQHRVPYDFENMCGESHVRVPQALKQFHQMPMGMSLDYSMSLPQNPMGMPLDYSMPLPHNPMGKTNQNIPFKEDGNVSSNGKKQVRKIVFLDPKHGKCNFEKENAESPVKRRKRSRNSDVSSESVANYDEIVKNLFVPAPPAKTVLIQPKFLNKDRGSNGNGIDPTQVRSISHRGLVQKYIDYLIMENEYITEISKAVSLPMENCVMDDPYLMDVIRIKIPFPTPKYMQFLKDFYPSIQVDWRALNHQLEQYRSVGDGAERFHSYYLDNRAVPVLLGEAFYFFQRESDRKIMTKSK